MKFDPSQIELVSIGGELSLVVRLGCRLSDSIPELEAARRSYHVRVEGDPLRLFLPARTETRIGARVRARVLFDDYRSWARCAGVDRPLGIKAFRAAMLARGFDQVQSNGIWWCDLQLQASEAQDG